MLFAAEGARGEYFSLLKAPGGYFRGQTRPDRIDANGPRFSGEAAAKDSLGRQP